MTSETTASRVPPHLRHLIVQQDYSGYTAVDQAVWRFVLLQTHARLKATAHPAYRDGLGQTGISVERIPRISEMDACLAPFGWGAACVDGFIPPRAFQELQSLSILPIAADMRTAEHLVYTPAPDIIHEAAGHAPILTDPTYASYLRAIGAAGARAFTLPDDARVDRAIHTLSEVKENPAATAEQVARAERALRLAQQRVQRVSEAGRLSRFYWWTAEYGLVGTPTDYKLYGAGLLSSLWESFACHDASVVKVPLSAAVTDVDYDVTRPQPQLFVAASFDALHETLNEVVRSLASGQGGEASVAEALAAQEIASFSLVGGITLVGRLERRVEAQGRSVLLELASPARADLGEASLRSDGASILAVLVEARAALVDLTPGPIRVRFADGLMLEGSLRSCHPNAQGSAALLVMDSGVLGAGSVVETQLGRGSVLAVASAVGCAFAGVPSDFFPSTALPQTSVPRPRTPDAHERALLTLYEGALEALSSALGSQVVPVFARLHQELQQHFKEDWLLRWNLLESLQKLAVQGPLTTQLRDELEALELHFLHRQPIASGLRYLAALAGAPGSEPAADLQND